jgi:adenylate cyclase
LIEAGLSHASMAATLDGLCRRLNEAGLPVSRAFASIETLHPLLRAHSATWERGTVAESEFQHDDLQLSMWHESPFRHMINNLIPRLERELTGANAQLDYPVLTEFRDAGYTAWMAFLLGIDKAGDEPSGYDLGVICSWATDRPGGWTAEQRAGIEEVSRTMALAMRSSIGFRVTRDLLATYLGRDASERVTSGDIQRGAVGQIEACLLYADLHGFTDYAEATPAATVAERLNAYLDCMGAPVEERGGQILKFLGDGLLAVFLLDGARDKTAICAAALDAAEEVLRRIAALNESAGAARTLTADIALHRGQVLYGNVGTARRLDFTVIGPAVNEAARLEGMCGQLGVDLLISSSFHADAGPAQSRMKSLGRHRLRGVREERELFALR